MSVLKAIFFFILTMALYLGVGDHVRRIHYSDAAHVITKVLMHADAAELRPYCVELVTGDALILKTGPRADKAKIICQEELGL